MDAHKHDQAGRKQENSISESQAVDVVLTEAKKHKLPPETFAFLELLYHDISADDLSVETPENLVLSGVALRSWLQQRKSGQTLVETVNPSPQVHGWSSRYTIVQVATDDIPFVFDSITNGLGRIRAELHLALHPIVRAERTTCGKLVTIHPLEDAHKGRLESIVQCRIARQPESNLSKTTDRIREILHDVQAAVQDWSKMRAQCHRICAQFAQGNTLSQHEDVHESLEFLRWLDCDHFTYLGFRHILFVRSGRSMHIEVPEKGGLGILRDHNVRIYAGLRNVSALPPEIQAFLEKPVPVTIQKANFRSRVHRNSYLDMISVKQFGDGGEVVGERLFVGLFTSSAYGSRPQDVPLVRRKVADAMRRSGFPPASHDGKALAHILGTYPRDELFQAGSDDLYETARRILRLENRTRTTLFLRFDPFERFVSCLLYVPKDRYDTTLRLRVRKILEERLNGVVRSYTAFMEDANALTRLHVVVHTKLGKIPLVAHGELERQINDLCLSWQDRLQESLRAAVGEHEGMRLFWRYAEAFSAGYRERFSATTATSDVAYLEEACRNGTLVLNLHRQEVRGRETLHLKIVVSGDALALSDVLPVLENMGLRVLGEAAYSVRIEGADPLTVQDFALEAVSNSTADTLRHRDEFHHAFLEIWTGKSENDRLNRLVVSGGLTDRQVSLLRAYCRYLLQVNVSFSQGYIEDTLGLYPHVARSLCALFAARFQTENDPRRNEKFRSIDREIESALEKVESRDHDHILHRFVNLIHATLRTNYFQRGPQGNDKSYISFKFDARVLWGLPAPRPYREVFVYSPEFEGVHLRFGPVARGGIRWSDRREDFRTEILGLVKAQRTKNAIIVPVGAKGGFVLKGPPTSEGARLRKQGVACYRQFMRALLEITDNLVHGEVVPPRGMVRYDGNDPYMVVAADKGTATFSDIANAIAMENDFWLGDAFASGGSEGYDHKAMGITAKGAWECVKRHFREMGKDIRQETFTCVGIGDMSGDVFGNGMLLSPCMRLVGAFNHRHIFLDPDPDPSKSFQERRRLFASPQLGWNDYDPEKLSAGGGVFLRSAKHIALSAPVQKLLGLACAQVSPMEVIRALLRAPVSLLWFGGIGTYVKERAESHADVGDHANDALRVDGHEVRAQVIGEGANLGMTQRGRIAYCLHGGRCNTDSIDNSAGVDCSDHEVNIKILLRMARGRLGSGARHRLLTEMTERDRCALHSRQPSTKLLHQCERGFGRAFSGSLRKSDARNGERRSSGSRACLLAQRGGACRKTQNGHRSDASGDFGVGFVRQAFSVRRDSRLETPRRRMVGT